MTGGRFQHRDPRRITQVGQCHSGVKSRFQRQPRFLNHVFEQRDRFISNRFQLQRRLFGLTRITDTIPQLLHAYPLRDRGFSKRDIANQGQIASKVLTVGGMQFEDDFLVGLGFGQRFANPGFVVVIEPSGDAVRDPFGVSDTAVAALEKNRQIPVLQRLAAGKNPTAFDQARGCSPFILGQRDQDWTFGLGKNVPLHNALPGNQRVFGQVGLHQPATFQTFGVAVGWQPNLDIEGLPLANQRWQVGPDDHHGRRR